MDSCMNPASCNMLGRLIFGWVLSKFLRWSFYLPMKGSLQRFKRNSFLRSNPFLSQCSLYNSGWMKILLHTVQTQQKVFFCADKSILPVIERKVVQILSHYSIVKRYLINAFWVKSFYSKGVESQRLIDSTGCTRKLRVEAYSSSASFSGNQSTVWEAIVLTLFCTLQASALFKFFLIN